MPKLKSMGAILRDIYNYTTSPSADSQRGAAELTIACNKRGRVI